MKLMVKTLLFVFGFCLLIFHPEPKIAEAFADGGTASFTHPDYACSYTVFYYEVTGAPANTCGILHITRNGIDQAPNPYWLCTDANGFASKGPYTADRDETATNIYIEWPDGTRTSGGDFYVKDISDPEVAIRTQGGQGVAIPTTFAGTAADTYYGTGFNMYSWTGVFARYYDETAGLYYNGTCYCSLNRDTVPCTIIQVYNSGYGLTWDCPPPPPAAHNPFHAYTWSVTVNDRCYSATAMIRFDPPR